ncbi:MAG: hypothetical protein FWH27_18865, partial [Planctomycetaceae bacterium]|nr:hypothetical protein [Planctomycetaceae bacterium]
MKQFLTCVFLLSFCPFLLAQEQAIKYLQISGVYPHLATHNQPPEGPSSPLRQEHGEAGIGAVVPWAGRLWYITYPQHRPRGSYDKLYEVDEHMNLTIREESVGGTHASRMIHKESNQLVIGPYFIDAARNVRACDLQTLVGRMTATMRHLFEPERLVYFFDMEGAIYEVDVNTLEVNKLFEKPFPGWHGKGAYTAQNRVVFSNNGELGPSATAYRNLLVGGLPKNEEEVGALVEWDGKDRFNIIERLQFTDVTGPGGIEGAPDDDAPLWAMGWDKRSVILKLLDGGQWYTFRLPKGSYSFDPAHGWYTEWPRIREYMPEQFVMIKHATLFEFPKTFSKANTSGIEPMVTHLRYIPDVTHWQGKILLAADEAAMLQNPMCGQPQSNLWFGTKDELLRFGPPALWGGVWQNDAVQAGVPSDPYLLASTAHRTLHLKHDAPTPVTFMVETDRQGNGNWQKSHEMTVINRYAYEILPASLTGEWIRLVPDKDCVASAMFHYLTPRENQLEEQAIFAPLAGITDTNRSVDAVMRPAARNRSLQVQINRVNGQDVSVYQEIEIDSDDPGTLQFTDAETSGATSAEIRFVSEVCNIDNQYVNVLPHAILVTEKSGAQFLLPRGNAAFDEPTKNNELRTLREVQSERWLANIHGTFYEVPRSSDNHSPEFAKMKPVASHDKRIVDFCSWRGLLVLSGTRTDAISNGHFFCDSEKRGLWFGQIDDLWKFGKPHGSGAVWEDEAVEAGVPSLPILLTNYDRKTVTISHDAGEPVTFRLECDFDHTGFVTAFEKTVPGGETLAFEIPVGFQAHWLRAVADKNCNATVRLILE